MFIEKANSSVSIKKKKGYEKLKDFVHEKRIGDINDKTLNKIPKHSNINQIILKNEKFFEEKINKNNLNFSLALNRKVDYLLTDKASKFAVVIVIRKEIKIRKVKPNIPGNNSSCNLNLKRYREGVKNLKIKLVNGKEEEISKRHFIDKETIFT